MRRSRASPAPTVVMTATRAVVMSGAVAALVAGLAACPVPASERCNSDADCEGDLVCTLGACAPANDLPSDAGSDDAGGIDAGERDAGSDDAGWTDAGSEDGGSLDAGTPDAGGCGAFEHDGGDGTCVALDSCSAGYGFSFLDDDGDGVGAGVRSDDCAALPLPPGRSDIGTDCEPADPARFQVQQGFDDDDGDTFTAAPAQACVGDVPEQGIVDVRRGPPHLAFAASAASSGASNAWNSPSSTPGCCGGVGSADLDTGSAGETATLVLSDYTCLTVPARLDVVRVRLRVRLPAGQAPQTLTTEATLLESGNGGATLSVSTVWQQGTFSLVTIEGTAADWGLSTTDPATLCAGTLTAQVVVVENGSYNGNVEIDYAVVELLGDNDCDPANAGFFAPLSLYGDGDGDSYVGGSPIASCVGDAALEEWDVLDPIDCDDTDNDAFPGQPSYFGAPRNGGGWDYNCNGTEDKRSVTDAADCVDPGDATCVPTSTTSRSGNCGEQIDADDCPAAAPCTLIQDTDAILCR